MENNNEKHGSDKEITIIVNGRSKTVTEKELSFSDIVALAFDTPPTGCEVVFTITYRPGHGNKPADDLAMGETVKLKEGMIFNVTATNKS